MTVKIEVNVSEHTPFMPPVRQPFSIPFQGEAMGAKIVSFDVNEMLGTKLRAFFQRDAGRDLFDLYHARTGTGFDAPRTIEAFTHYIAGEKKNVRRGDFVESFDNHMKAPTFRTDKAVDLRLTSG